MQAMRIRGVGLAVLAQLLLLPLTGLPTRAEPGATDEPRRGGQIHSAVEVSRAQVQLERQKIVANLLELTESEGKAFWPLYRTFRAETAKTEDRRVALITRYAQSYPNATPDEARKMLDELLSIQESEIKTKKRYVPRFRKILPELKVTRYFQLENKLDAIVRVQIADQVPLIF